MFTLISDILDAVKFPELNFRNIKELEILHHEPMIGNNAVIFRVSYEGNIYAMRCYRRSKPYLREIYGERFYAEELNVDTPLSPQYIDVVLSDWVDGISLSKVTDQAIAEHDTKRLKELADRFDRYALQLIDADWAHGDLSPDNIIIDQSGELHLIDFDSKYIPQFEGRKSIELGTQAYQSPRRGEDDFHARIDDFAIGIISTSLHALALDPSIKRRFPYMDGLLIDGQQVADDKYEVVNEVLSLFAHSGCFKEYRILKLLRLNQLVIDSLPDLLSRPVSTNCILELFVNWGLCGYCDQESGEIVIPPLYDEAFEFRGDYALVRVARWWFYIDKSGCTVESCGEMSHGKPPKERAKG